MAVAGKSERVCAVHADCNYGCGATFKRVFNLFGGMEQGRWTECTATELQQAHPRMSAVTGQHSDVPDGCCCDRESEKRPSLLPAARAERQGAPSRWR